MRITKAQLFAVSALCIPVLSFLASLAFLWARSLLGFQPWYEDGPQLRALDAASVAVAFAAFLCFGTLALLAAKPSSRTWRIARRWVLHLVSFVLVIVGIVVLCAHLAEPGLALRDLLLISAPLAFACLYALAREYDPPRSRRDAALFVARATVACLAVSALGIAIAIGLHELGAGVVYRGGFFFLLGFLALTIPLFPVNLVLGTLARLRGGSATTVFANLFLRLAPCPMSREEAELEWAAMRRVPQGGTLIEGWRHSSSPVLRLHCEGADGRRYVLFGNVQKAPVPHRLAGLFVHSFTSSWHTRKTERGIGLTVQLECAWTPLTDGSLEAELSKLGEAATAGLPAQGWSCPDGPAVRLDLIDANGRDFLVLVDPTDDPEAFWFAGLFFGFARVPTLASDRMGPSWSLPSTTTSNPPPRTQPSSS